MFGASLYAFASYIFRKAPPSASAEMYQTDTTVVEIFVDTLAPASLVGIATKLVGLVCSGYVGGMVDRMSRVKFVRGTITIHKVGHAHAPQASPDAGSL